MRISDWSSDVCSSVLTGRHVLSTPSKRCGSPGPPFTRTPMSTSEVPRRLLADPLARAALGVTTLVYLLLYLVTLGDLSFDSAVRPFDAWLVPTAGELWTRARVPFQFEARSEEHTSELQSLMRSSYAVFCLKKKEDR